MITQVTTSSTNAVGQKQPVQVVVLGVGTVGAAVLRAVANPRFEQRFSVAAAVSARGWLPGAEIGPLLQQRPETLARSTQNTGGGLRDRVASSGRGTVAPEQAPLLFDDTLDVSDGSQNTECERAERVIVDATASQLVAACHPNWLAQGCHVVTANKWGLGGDAALWAALRPFLSGACALDGRRVRYGASATVGAGLPFLRAVTRLAEAEEVLHLRGCLSGTLAWLLDASHSDMPFSETVRDAVALGLCEPNPLADLGGGDVARKAVILARAAGCVADAERWDVEPVIPAVTVADIPDSDALMASRFAHSRQVDTALAYVADIDVSGTEAVAHFGVQQLTADDPLAGHGTGNVLQIRTSRYADHPVVMAGPGAGPGVTAGAIVDDLLAVTTPG